MTLQQLKQLELHEIGEWPPPVQWFCIALMCTGLAAGAYFLLLQDQQQQLRRLVDEEQNLRRAFESQQKRAANLAEYRTRLSAMQDTFGDMLHQLPDQAEVADLLVEVSQAGLALGLEFVLFQPQTEASQTFYAELPVKLHVLGRYHQLGRFVSDLAALPRIVTLHDIVLTPQTGKQPRQPNQAADGLLLMQATARTYRYLDGVGDH